MMGTQRNHVYLPLPRCPCLIPLNILASPQISLPSWGARACVWPCLTSLSVSWPGAGVLLAKARPRWGPPRAARSQSDRLPWDASGLQQKAGGGTICSPDPQASSSRAKLASKAGVKCPIQGACLGTCELAGPMGCPHPPWNAGFVSGRPSWLGAVGRQE